MVDLYAILEVPPDASREAIRASFRVLARRWHPDRGGSARRMQAISEAWSVLGRSELRANYDRIRSEDAANGRRAGSASPESMIPQRQTDASARDPNTLDYGRYTGWTIEALAFHDPDYLEWLRRSPGGRSWRGRIDAALDQRPVLVARATPRSPRRHRRFWHR